MRSRLTVGVSTLALVACASTPVVPEAPHAAPPPPPPAAPPTPAAPPAPVVPVPISTTTDAQPAGPSLVLTAGALMLRNGDETLALVRAPADTTKGFDPSTKSSGPQDLYVNPVGKAVGLLRHLHELMIVADASTANRTIAELLYTARRSRSPAPVKACLSVRSASPAPDPPHAICLAPFLVFSGGTAPTSPGLSVRLQILPDGFAVRAGSWGFGPGCHGAGDGITVPNAGADYDFRGLSACLTAIKHEADGARGERHVTVGGGPGVPYQVIVSTIDAARATSSGEELFPDVTLFDGGDDMVTRFGDMGLRGAVEGEKVTNVLDTLSVPPPSNSDKVLDALRPKFLACYNQGLKANPAMPGGAVTFRVKVDPNGAVTSVGPMSTMGLSGDVVGCISRILQGAHFEAPGPPGSTMQVPVSFGKTDGQK